MRTRPRPSSITLAGLRSRCRTPRSCAAARPAQIWRAMSSALSAGRRPMRRQQRREVLAVDVLHREEMPTRVSDDLADVEHAAHVRVRDLARDADFGQKSLRTGADRRRGARGRNFSATGSTELEVVRAVHLAHAAATEQTDDAVAAGEHRPRCESSDRHHAGGCVAPASPRPRSARAHRTAPLPSQAATPPLRKGPAGRTCPMRRRSLPRPQRARSKILRPMQPS